MKIQRKCLNLYKLKFPKGFLLLLKVTTQILEPVSSFSWLTTCTEKVGLVLTKELDVQRAYGIITRLNETILKIYL